ncbi:hypothetical protein SL034_001539 [Vibrio harveyi]|uniref:Uncharacterized protein n=1 Tax=Vibrio harveyi TaxID=669 RepID=A0ABM5Y6V7_VIBHA|nr:hypothetical protein [Vibrio harveyi]AMG01354.1 hypothetical protein AL538_27280 [Vibrio harveyi]ELY1986517.1 hypothetical protein [Vibrio harveyi]
MFKVVKDRIVKDWPATLTVAQDGGKVEVHKITLDLKLIDTDDFQTLSAKGDKELLKTIVVGWGGIGDKDGKALPFDADWLDVLAKDAAFVQGTLDAFYDAISGKAAEKNL